MAPSPATHDLLVREAPDEPVTTPAPLPDGPGVAPDGERRRPWTGLRWADLAVEGLVGAALVAELIVILVNVGSRLFTGNSVIWSQEVSELALYTIAFLGGAIAYGKGSHMSIEGIAEKLPERVRRYRGPFVDAVVFAVSAGSVALFVPVVAQRMSEQTPILRMPAAVMSLPFALGMALICVLSFTRLAHRDRRHAAVALLAAAALTGLVVLAAATVVPLLPPTALVLVVLVVLVATLFIGVPVAFVLIAASGVFLYWGGYAELVAIPIGMQSGANSFLLLAVPFFILVGAVMNAADLTRPLTELVDALLGRLRGGALLVVVVTMYIFSGISGSKVADVAAVGGTMREMLDARKVQRGEAVAVLAAAAVMGETVPPSIVLLVLGSITTLSTTTLFVAGLLPAAFLGLCVMGLILVRARRHGGLVSPRVPARAKARASLTALPALLLPVGLVLGIVLGVATPTEVSAVAVGYAVLLAVLYRRGSRTVLWQAIRETITTAGMVLFVIAAASPFAQTLAIAGVSSEIGSALSALKGFPIGFMLVSVVLLVIMGQLLEGLAAVLIFAPLLLPIATGFGIDPVQYCMVLIVAMGIGSFAPPAGVGFFVAALTGRESVERSVRHFIPYALVLLGGLLLLALVPWFSTAVPDLLHLRTN